MSQSSDQRFDTEIPEAARPIDLGNTISVAGIENNLPSAQALIDQAAEEKGEPVLAPTPANLNQLFRNMMEKSFHQAEHKIKEEIKKLIQPTQSEQALRALVDTKLGDRIVNHLENVSTFRKNTPEITEVEYDIFIRQLTIMAQGKTGEHTIIAQTGYTPHQKRIIENLEAQILNEADQLRTQYPFSDPVLYYHAKIQLFDKVVKLHTKLDLRKYRSDDPARTNKPRASANDFLANLKCMLRKERNEIPIIQTINDTPEFKKRLNTLLEQQKNLSQRIRDIQQQLKSRSEPITLLQAKELISKQFWKKSIELRKRFHKLKVDANSDGAAKSPKTTKAQLQKEAFAFIQWHLENSEESRSAASIQALRKIAGTEACKAQTTAHIDIHQLQIARNTHRELLATINRRGTPFETKKKFFLKHLQILLINHLYMTVTQDNRQIERTITLASERLSFRLEKSLTRQDLLLTLKLSLKENNIPCCEKEGKPILYPDIDIATPAPSAASSKKKRKKKKRKKANSVLDHITKLTKRKEDQQAIQKIDGTKYTITWSDETITLRQPNNSKNQDFAAHLLARLQLLKDLPDVAIYLDHLTRIIAADDASHTISETIVSGSLFNLCFTLNDNSHFEVSINIVAGKILYKINQHQAKDHNHSLTLGCKIPSDNMSENAKQARFMLSLLSSPLLSGAAELAHSFTSKGFRYQTYPHASSGSFEQTINLAITTPEGEHQTIGLMQENGNYYCYINPLRGAALNSHLPRFQLDPEGVQTLATQAWNAYNTYLKPLKEIDAIQSELLGYTLTEGDEKKPMTLSAICEAHMQIHLEMERYNKLFRHCQSLESSKEDWANELKGYFDERFLQQLDRIIEHQLSKHPVGSDDYFQTLIALPKEIASRTNKHGAIFSRIQKEINARLHALRTKQFAELKATLPTELLTADHALTAEEITRIERSTQRLSKLIKQATKGLRSELTLTMQQLADKVKTEKEEREKAAQEEQVKQLQEKPFDANLARHTFAINQPLSTDSLHNIQNANQKTYSQLQQLVTIATQHKARIYLSGSAALEVADRLPASKYQHSDLDIWILASSQYIIQLREQVLKVCPQMSKAHGPSQQFNYEKMGEAKLEVITTTCDIRSIFNSYSTHNALVEIQINKDKLCLTSVTGFVPEDTNCSAYHLDETTFSKTKYDLQERVRTFLLACKIACKYGTDPLSEALLDALEKKISIENCAVNTDFITKHFRFIHNYVSTFICHRYPELAARFILKTPPRGTLVNISAAVGGGDTTTTGKMTVDGGLANASP